MARSGKKQAQSNAGGFAFGIMPSRWDFDDEPTPRPAKPRPAPAPPVAAAPPKQFAPGTQIAYDPELIAHLTACHGSLRQLCTDISAAVNANAPAKAEVGLQQLLRSFEQQQLEEGVKLYIYLGKCLEGSELQELVTSVKQDISRASRKLRGLVRRHVSAGDSTASASLTDDFDEVVEILERLIEQKETSLYPLYLPPDNY